MWSFEVQMSYHSLGWNLEAAPFIPLTRDLPSCRRVNMKKTLILASGLYFQFKAQPNHQSYNSSMWFHQKMWKVVVSWNTLTFTFSGMHPFCIRGRQNRRAKLTNSHKPGYKHDISPTKRLIYIHSEELHVHLRIFTWPSWSTRTCKHLYDQLHRTLSHYHCTLTLQKQLC